MFSKNHKKKVLVTPDFWVRVFLCYTPSQAKKYTFVPIKDFESHSRLECMGGFLLNFPVFFSPCYKVCYRVNVTAW